MCGRYLVTASMRKLGVSFGFDEFSEIRITPRFKVAPSQRVPIVRNQVGHAPGIIRQVQGGTDRQVVEAHGMPVRFAPCAWRKSCSGPPPSRRGAGPLKTTTATTRTA